MAATRILNRTIGSSLAAMLLALSAWPALAGPWMVTVDTAPLQGQAGFLAFDYLAGDPATTNQVQLSAFASNAGLGAASSSGDVTGTLVPGPLRLGGGAQLFSEWLQGVNAFGNTISFVLDRSSIPPRTGPTNSLSSCSTRTSCRSPPPTPPEPARCSTSTSPVPSPRR